MNNYVNPLLARAQDYLFVYGTLMRDRHGKIHRFLAGRAEFIDNATYCGKLYNVEHYPGAVASDNLNDKVYGEVYAILNAVALIPTLDQYEECGPEFAEPHEYIRLKQQVRLSNGEPISAWMYLYNRPVGGNGTAKSWLFKPAGRINRRDQTNCSDGHPRQPHHIK